MGHYWQQNVLSWVYFPIYILQLKYLHRWGLQVVFFSMCDLQFIFLRPQCLRLSAANHISAAVNWAWEIFKHWKMRSKQRSLQLCPHLESLHLMCVESNGYLISVSKSHHFFFYSHNLWLSDAIFSQFLPWLKGQENHTVKKKIKVQFKVFSAFIVAHFLSFLQKLKVS